MDVIQQIKELETQKAKLLTAAKADALKRAKAAINDLNTLGFTYRLVDDSAPTQRATKPSKATGKKRHAGIRETVYKALASNGEGMKRAELVTALELTDKSGKQAVSNALSNLKKAGRVKTADGKYHAVE